MGCLLTFVHAQAPQQKYLDAKYAYTSGQYEHAGSLFSTLTTDPTFGAYATFYSGLSRYHAGDFKQALDLLGQLQAKFPDFKQTDEVNFWRSFLYFKSGDFNNGVQQANKLANHEDRRSLYSEFLRAAPFAELRKIYLQFPDEHLLEAMVYVGVRSTLSEDDRSFLTQVVDASGMQFLSSDDYQQIKKDKYVIAALLPFMFDGMENADRVVRNTLVMDLYQGMRLAADWLAEEGKPVDVVPYDTRKDKNQTMNLLVGNGLKNADLIVGPLFPEPIEAVSAFANENKINVINPVTSNSRVFESNELAYILKPSYQTMARKAAEYMARGSKKKQVMVYFEKVSPDREIAEEYTQAIQELGFTVTNFEPVDVASSRKLLAKFTNQQEMVLRITDEDANRMRADGRIIRSRPKFNASGNAAMREDGTPDVEYYEMVFTFNTDSLDHIFAATRSNVIANNFVGAIETNPDSIRLLGLSDWLEFTMLDYKQLERLRVSMIHPDYTNRANPFLQQVEKRFVQTYKRKPSLFHLFGFETIWWAGHMMHAHGKYFQNGFFDKNDIPSVFYGHDFLPGGNDNQLVPIVQFKNKQLQEVNLVNESSEE
jgi:hypothetical protein